MRIHTYPDFSRNLFYSPKMTIIPSLHEYVNALGTVIGGVKMQKQGILVHTRGTLASIAAQCNLLKAFDVKNNQCCYFRESRLLLLFFFYYSKAYFGTAFVLSVYTIIDRQICHQVIRPSSSMPVRLSGTLSCILS